MSAEGIADWVEVAGGFPIAFSQVREDPLLDLWVVNELPNDAQVAMIASGGCTAALLTCSSSIDRLHLVDPNPAQMALTRLKLRFLQNCDFDSRLTMLGHAPLPTAERQERLALDLAALGLSSDALGPEAIVAELGPDHAGRYEFVFSALRRELVGHEEELAEVLRLRDPIEQTRRTDSSTDLGLCLDEALDEVLSLPNLVHLFGEEATHHPAKPFARHFGQRIRHAFSTMAAERNPYLWQMLAGCYPEDRVIPWLDEPAPVHLPEVTWSIGFMAEELETMPDSFDFIHLSNILDWLSPEQARNTLEIAWKALRPGGWTLIRQLNSSLDVQSLGSRFNWLTEEAVELLENDRSFFYRQLHLGKKA
jgi:S-adenosylmethionine-diacylglycerol 3-amino-3-carboxypropyl transferase